MGTSSQTPPTVHRIAELAPVAEALAALVAEYADLPRPYVYMFTTSPRIGLQLDGPAEFELWREALAVPPAEVDLVVTPGSAWLDASGEFRGVAFDMSGHDVPVSVKQSRAPRGAAAVAA
ncbi:hypothetical protein ACIRPR_06360 [Streptomyces griseoflavus]|uniref:hypothetical protein n=1 Tax=Streptomyces griseoflavus TaxID=35619 RepID=UPI0037F53695